MSVPSQAPPGAIFLSIAVVALNEEKRLSTLLHSIDCQRRPSVNIEVVLIDNGSVDGTLRIMEEYRDTHEMVHLEVHPGTLGSAWDRALRAARGDYVAFLGADMQLPPGWLTTIAELLREHPCDAIVAKIVPLFRYQGPLNAYLSAYHLGDTAADGPWMESTFHDGGLVVRRDRALEIGFDSHLPVSEDGEFSYRFLEKGFRVCYFPSRYVVLDEQFYDLAGLISYFRKLGLAGVVLLRSTRSAKVAHSLLRTLLEPLTPHYLVSRFRKGRERVRISYRTWLLAGMARLLTMALAVMIYGPLGWRLPPRIQRRKA